MAQFTGRLLTSLARWAMFALAFAIPLTYFPWTVDPLEVNKQTVAVIGVVLLAVAWLGRMLVEKRASVRALWVALPVGLFLLGTAVSSALSLSPYASIVGQSAQEYTSLMSLGLFAVMMVVGAHVAGDRGTQRAIWSSSLIASAIVGALAIPPFFHAVGYNVIGTPNALGLYLVTMSLLGASLWLTSRDEGERDMLLRGPWGLVVRVAIVLTSISALAVLLALDYWVLWMAALVGSLVVFTFGLARAHEFPHPGKFVLPMMLFVVSLLFIFVPTVVRSPYAAEIAPSYALTWDVVRASFADHGAFFGSGPGTFVVTYAENQPLELNTTTYWDTRFDRGASHALTMLSTFGLLPTLAFVAFVLCLGALSVVRLVRERDHDAWKLTFVPFVAWVVLVFGIVFYAQNFTLAFLFWIASSMLLSHTAGAERVYPFARSPRAGLVSAFLFVLATVGMLTVLFVTVTRYKAEIAFAKGVALDRSGGEIDEVIVELDAAATANRWNDAYYRNLGNALLYKIGEVLSDASADPEYVKALVSAAVNAGVRATELGPSNVANWELRGDIYREVTPVVTDADEYALAAYKQATILAPTNPKYHVGIARTHIAQADILHPIIEGDDADLAESAQARMEEVLTDAEAALTKALSLKSDYVQAQYYMAFVRERQGKLDEAVKSMEFVRATSPSDVGVSLQLALLYMRQDEMNLAKQELERAIDLAPNFANARWYLSSILARESDISGAIAQLEALLTLNPGNVTITNRIDELKAGEVTPPTVPDPLDENTSAPPTEGSTP